MSTALSTAPTQDGDRPWRALSRSGAPLVLSLPNILGASPAREREDNMRVEMCSWLFIAESAAIMTTELRRTCERDTNHLHDGDERAPALADRTHGDDEREGGEAEHHEEQDQVLNTCFTPDFGSWASPAATAIISMLRSEKIATMTANHIPLIPIGMNLPSAVQLRTPYPEVPEPKTSQPPTTMTNATIANTLTEESQYPSMPELLTFMAFTPMRIAENPITHTHGGMPGNHSEHDAQPAL